ncbi:hypothetical protein AABM38_10400 [Heyndrickxia sp. MSNUG]|uniref:hypothetical protein n=1 Tax=Heyndrickxia sp. MSNUG TaxID=3136677 RepID=UPI003C2C7180
MELQQREFSEKVLKQLFIGSQLDGVKFGPGPGSTLIKFMHYTSKQPDELWVNIESKWTVFPSAINEFPNSEDEMDDSTEEEEYSLLIKLQREKVIDIKLGETVPHLKIGFSSGLTIFVNGHHDMYECWQAGDGAGYTGEEWLIVATPGDDITTWAPNDFN